MKTSMSDLECAARRMSRNVSLVLATEPLANKPGCTTRFEDCSPNARLSYFVVAGLNVQWAFYDLAMTIFREGRQPSSIYRFAVEAQMASTANRGGSKITFGQTLLLLPLVAAHALSIVRGSPTDDVDSARSEVRPMLERTTPDDVMDLDRFCRVALDQSAKSNAQLQRERRLPDPHFAGLYGNIIECMRQPDFGALIVAQEAISSYPNAFALFDSWNQSKHADLLAFTERVFIPLKERYGRVDIAADLIAGAMYLILSAQPSAVLFP